MSRTMHVAVVVAALVLAGAGSTLYAQKAKSCGDYCSESYKAALAACKRSTGKAKSSCKARAKEKLIGCKKRCSKQAR